MKIFLVIIRILFVLFFALCMGVHVYGLFTHAYKESDFSHIVHLASYSLCLFAFSTDLSARRLMYLIGFVYPFLFHANCAYQFYAVNGKPNSVCTFVVIILPVAFFALWKITEPQPKKK